MDFNEKYDTPFFSNKDKPQGANDLAAEFNDSVEAEGAALAKFLDDQIAGQAALIQELRDGISAQGSAEIAAF